MVEEPLPVFSSLALLALLVVVTVVFVLNVAGISNPVGVFSVKHDDTEELVEFVELLHEHNVGVFTLARLLSPTIWLFSSSLLNAES